MQKQTCIFWCVESFRALFNTTFMTFLIVLFGNTGTLKASMRSRFDSIYTAFVGINGLIEAIVCFVAGAAISRGFVRYMGSYTIAEDLEIKIQADM